MLEYKNDVAFVISQQQTESHKQKSFSSTLTVDSLWQWLMRRCGSAAPLLGPARLVRRRNYNSVTRR